MSTSHTPPPVRDAAFVNEVRLGARQWGVVFGAAALVSLCTPWLWDRAERFETGPGYRIPYELSGDYWLFERRLRRLEPGQAVVLGDSVVWGEYVLPGGTLTHFLDIPGGRPGRFANAGVNGLFPVAMEGLLRHYGSSLRGRKVLLHWNPLWLSNTRADLQEESEAGFNHPGLVPQFHPRIPAYRAEAAERLGAILDRNVPFLAWVNHLQDAYFDQQDIPSWTLSDNGGAGRRPNAYRNPLARITFEVPCEPAPDPKRGPDSRRHRPWNASGGTVARFEWVDLESSLQWAAFRRTVALLRERGNDLLVVIGPFNEWMMTPESREVHRGLRDGAGSWLTAQRVPHVIPEVLPSELYADASHPLTAGYAGLAGQLSRNRAFADWLSR